MTPRRALAFPFWAAGWLLVFLAVAIRIGPLRAFQGVAVMARATDSAARLLARHPPPTAPAGCRFPDISRTPHPEVQ